MLKIMGVVYGVDGVDMSILLLKLPKNVPTTFSHFFTNRTNTVALRNAQVGLFSRTASESYPQRVFWETAIDWCFPSLVPPMCSPGMFVLP